MSLWHVSALCNFSERVGSLRYTRLPQVINKSLPWCNDFCLYSAPTLCLTSCYLGFIFMTVVLRSVTVGGAISHKHQFRKKSVTGIRNSNNNFPNIFPWVWNWPLTFDQLFCQTDIILFIESVIWVQLHFTLHSVNYTKLHIQLEKRTAIPEQIS